MVLAYLLNNRIPNTSMLIIAQSNILTECFGVYLPRFVDYTESSDQSLNWYFYIYYINNYTNLRSQLKVFAEKLRNYSTVLTSL